MHIKALSATALGEILLLLTQEDDLQRTCKLYYISFVFAIYTAQKINGILFNKAWRFKETKMVFS